MITSLRTRLAVLLGLGVIVGCGGLVVVDERNKAGNDSLPTSDAGPSTQDAAPEAPIPLIPVDAAPGCAVYTPANAGVAIRANDMGCGVAVAVSAPMQPKVVVGTVGVATFHGDELRLVCTDGGTTVLMEATIRCYQGNGFYDVPAGALTLGGKVSDRKCRLGAFLTDNELRGMISCDDAPADPTNLFANSGPRGLGEYWLRKP